MAPPLLATASMPEPSEPPLSEPAPQDSEHHVERHVVYETVSSSSSRANTVTFVVIIIIAIALVAWVVMQMR